MFLKHIRDNASPHRWRIMHLLNHRFLRIYRTRQQTHSAYPTQKFAHVACSPEQINQIVE